MHPIISCSSAFSRLQRLSFVLVLLMTTAADGEGAAAAAAASAPTATRARTNADTVASLGSADTTTMTTPAEEESLPASSTSAIRLDEQTIEAYEQLDKWKGCDAYESHAAVSSPTRRPTRLVHQHNKSRAAAMGFPTRLAVATGMLGLTEHETSAVFGWTTGDYRFVNPIARNADDDSSMVEFDEYPYLPQDTARVKCRLTRQDVLPYVRVLQSALSKLPSLPDRNQRLWRGHRRRFSPTQRQPGSVLRMGGFTSTTRDREGALEFATKPNEGRSDKRTLMCVLQHENAKCISRISARREEGEVLFAPGTLLEVVDPPGDAVREDLEAVRGAVKKMREGVSTASSMPRAEIDLVYVREVVNDDDAARGERRRDDLPRPIEITN